MEHFLSMVTIQGTLFLYLLIGYLARKWNIIREAAVDSFIDFLLKIALPCMIFNSFRIELTPERMRSGLFCLIASFAVCFVSWLLGKILYRRSPFSERCILQYATMISNAGFAGLPLVESAFGAQALFYASIFLIPIRIFMWTAGISLFTDKSLRYKVKSVVTNPAIIAVLLGLVWMAFKLPLPPVLATAVTTIGGTTSSLSIIVVGVILAGVDWKTILNPTVFYYSAIRLLVLPGLLLVILKGMRVSVDIIAPCVVLTGMPAGATTALLAQKYGADAKFASQCIFVSTLLSLLTVPLLTFFIGS
ncbi:AEC family transporter [Ruminococcaceae bacterium OttesenSCG-928-L11]|nr:AEC family transporter [Ruminococcaceae bacterium OttesenSCG-928-L11]